MLVFMFCGESQAKGKSEAIKEVKKLKNKFINQSLPLASEYDVAQMYINDKEKVYEIDFDASKEFCSEARDFKIDSLAMILQYHFAEKDWVWETPQWDCHFHIVKIDYELTCANNLTYKGTHYIASEEQRTSLNHKHRGRGRRMEREANKYGGWQENLSIDEYINENGTITKDAVYGEWGHYTIAKIDTQEIFKKWENQKVEIPEHRYSGAPGILPRPVLLIHGLGGTYEDWGVSGNSSSEITKYDYGSLPDMLARSNNLYTRSYDSTGKDGIRHNINNNGIYFLQIDYNIQDMEGTEKNILAFYEKIEFVMDDYYKKKLGIEWRGKKDIYQIDLVAHSLGGLIVRAMLGLANDKVQNLAPLLNISKLPKTEALNHINRLITINTPHFGSQLAAETDSLPAGISLLVKDIDNPTDRILAENKVILSWEKMAFLAFGIVLGYEPDLLDYYIIMNTNFFFRLKGPYIGTYKAEGIMQIPYFYDSYIETVQFGSITTLEDFAKMLKKTRESGVYLDKDSKLLKELSKFSEYFDTGLFPLRPNGTKITMLAMYSDSAHKALPKLFELVGDDANRLCAAGEKDPRCFAAGDFIKSYAEKYASEYSGFNVRFTEAEFDKDFHNALLDIQNDWLTQSDGLVEVNSQKFYNPDRNDNLIDNPNLKGYFLTPRNYAIHDANYPEDAVLHGPFKPLKEQGATRQGMDILCALTPACDKEFERAVTEGKQAILYLATQLVDGEYLDKVQFSKRSVDVTGNFDLAPIYIAEGIQALSLSSNGETILTAEYEPGKGSSITLKNNPAPITKSLAVGINALNAAAVQTELLVGAEIATQPYISRKGDSVTVSFMNYSGRAFKKSFFMPKLPSNLTISVLAEAGAAMSPVIIGTGNATNPETQKPPPPPPGSLRAPVTLVAVHREAKGQHEINTSRPRTLVHNTTDTTMEFSKVAYYFTADPARVPNVVVDYPQVPVKVEHLGGDQWRFVLDVGNQKIAAKDFYPSKDGWQIRMHYNDWYEFDHFDDWSADYSIGIPKINRKIVIYDKNDKIIWGKEPEAFKTKDEEIIPTPQGTITWNDEAPWETNTLKPRVTIKNTGSIAIDNYHAELYFRVPQGKTLTIPSPDDWHTPESTPSVKNVGGRVWKLDLHFDKHILYPSDSVSEGNIGLHLTDWSNFDKTVCGVVLKDKNGNVLFGKEPTVNECESYNGPNLLPPMYSSIINSELFSIN